MLGAGVERGVGNEIQVDFLFFFFLDHHLVLTDTLAGNEPYIYKDLNKL